MQKKIAIITIGSEYANVHYQQLKNLFGDYIDIQIYIYDSINANTIIEADLVLNSISSLYYTMTNTRENTKVLIPSTTITNSSYEKILSIPPDTSVFVVNNTFVSTIETITLFYDLGLSHLNYIPYYPGIEMIKPLPDLNIAITPAEAALVPDNINRIIDIGHRILDADTLVEIAMTLDLEYLLSEEPFIKQLNTLKIAKNSLTSQFNNINTLKSQILSLLNVMNDGIIIIDNEGSIVSFNEEALSIIGGNYNLINKKLNDIIPEIHYNTVFETGIQTKNKLIEYNAHNISVKAVPVKTSSKITNAIIIINDYNEKERSQYELRSQFLDKKSKAKYTFDDIIGNEKPFVELKDLVKKQAKSNSSILIIGESGTGKELFAQAIHNSSNRKNFPFIAVNCAAVPESLLESELFGYEEGAFTGAKKGGKPGYFEIAHKGTIFLDEIGEMNLNLQTRLLRVLEEREVIRIGGNSVIPIDIRIISATNRNLWHSVEKGEFRKDLFYRLNVLPVFLPPLRSRPADIFLLFNYFKEDISADFTLSQEAEHVISAYPWHGNIRELKNCVEYLASLEKSRIDENDLYNILNQEIKGSVSASASPSYSGLEKEMANFLETIQPEKENYLFVLECLYTCYINKQRIGRRSIMKSSQERDIFITEAEIRKMLTILEAYNLARLSNGRGGTTITTQGIKAYKLLMQSMR